MWESGGAMENKDHSVFFPVPPLPLDRNPGMLPPRKYFEIYFAIDEF